MSRHCFSTALAFALVLSMATPAAAERLRLPAARAPANAIFSPAAIAGNLRQRGYRIETMRRQDTAYSITGTGPRGNRVQMLVDGRSGEVVGLSVLQAAPNLAAAVAEVLRGPRQARFRDETTPFGIVVPDRNARGWVTVPAGAYAAGQRGNRYVRQASNARGYRFAVPARSVRPGRGGRSRSTIAHSRMRQPIYQVYDANGALLQSAAEAEDRAALSELQAEEAIAAADDLALENAYLEGALDGADLDEVSDYDAEDGDLDIADNAADDYDGDEYDDTYDDYAEGVSDDASGAADDDADDTNDAGAAEDNDAGNDDDSGNDDAGDDDVGDEEAGDDDPDDGGEDGGDDDDGGDDGGDPDR